VPTRSRIVFNGEDVIVYPIEYNTFSDVQKARDKDAEIRYDEDDRPFVVKSAPRKGERSSDYMAAKSFLRTIADQTVGELIRSPRQPISTMRSLR
jgi:hypothetical protein